MNDARGQFRRRQNGFNFHFASREGRELFFAITNPVNFISHRCDCRETARYEKRGITQMVKSNSTRNAATKKPRDNKKTKPKTLEIYRDTAHGVSKKNAEVSEHSRN